MSTRRWSSTATISALLWISNTASGENFPLYCQVSRGACVVHLSEHAGDASPGAKAFAWMRGIRGFHAELTAKDYRYLKPGLEDAPWGLQMTVTDPFSNRIAFCERL
jgi:hypothetical protein